MLHFFKNLSVRGTLIFWLVTSALVLFSILTVIISNLMWKVMHEQVDNHLYSLAVDAKQIVETNHTQDRVELLKNEVTAEGTTVMLLNSDGMVLTQVSTTGNNISVDQELKEKAHSALVQPQDPQYLTKGELRYALVPAKLLSGNGLIVVGYSLNILKSAFHNIVMMVSIVMLVAMLVLVIGWIFLLNHYLSPNKTQAEKTDPKIDNAVTSEMTRVQLPSSPLNNLTHAMSVVFDKVSSG